MERERFCSLFLFIIHTLRQRASNRSIALIELTIEDLLEKKFQEPEFSDCFIIDITSDNLRKVSVFIDCDSGVTFEKCRKISRYLEEFLDTEQVLDEKYTLEVSSAGVDRPLKYKRQYHNNLGRHLKVVLVDESVRRGILREVGEEHVVLEKSQKKGKKKKKKKDQEPDETIIPFDQIQETKVEIVF